MSAPDSPAPRRLHNACGLAVEWLWHGGLRTITWQGVTLNLFPGSAAEAGPANRWLRLIGDDGQLRTVQALQGSAGILRQAHTHVVPDLPNVPEGSPRASPGHGSPAAPAMRWEGVFEGLVIEEVLQLAADQPRMAWHLRITNTAAHAQAFDLQALQDIGLARWDAIRLNEYYVSQYVDLQPLQHPQAGWVIAARQNQAVDGRHPACLMGSLGHAVSLATDAWSWCGTALRCGGTPPALLQGLPGTRLQHEHALIALQEAPVRLAPGQSWQGGFFLALQADHPPASGPQDLEQVALARAALPAPWAPQGPAVSAAAQLAAAAAAAAAATAAAAGAGAGADAQPRSDPGGPARARDGASRAAYTSLFARAPWLRADALTPDEIARHWPGPRLHEEFDGDGRLLAFFRENGTHVVLRDKERLVQRPHGHLLRSGRHLVPDETALTSTVWMAGGFHSMLTQGHVGINRCLGTVRSGLGLYRSQGLRVFVAHSQGAWQQLGLPSAFEMQDDRCAWWYRHGTGLLRVVSWAEHGPHAMGLSLEALEGSAVAWRLTHNIALGGEDHWPPRPLQPRRADDAVFVAVPAGGELAARFPAGGLWLRPEGGMTGLQVGGDERLYAHGCAWGEPFVVIDTNARTHFVMRLVPQLVEAEAPPPDALPLPRWTPASASSTSTSTSTGTGTGTSSGAGTDAAAAAQCLAQIVPWFAHNALVHYLSPRGLEQFSGGGWGTRDVCQGPLEMLLALDRPQPVRDLLCRVFAAQDPGGDWPQWFMFFPREQHIRAGDAHGDIVFWPLLGLARYLVCTEDASILDEPLPFYARPGEAAQAAPLWQHVQRAWAVVRARQFPGTRLVNYGHGDWNDSLQPADLSLRERLCSSWTVTLHHQVLRSLALGLAACGRVGAARPLVEEAGRLRADFRRLLWRDGTVGAYALFDEPGGEPALLLHPRDARSGAQLSLLPLMHAVLEDLLSPDEAQTQCALIEQHLMGPDGARLFDRPLAYHGGPQRLFQRAESSAFFGREIGLMYMHAHLRYAEMLAHLGQAQRFFEALQRIHPIGLQQLVPAATRRQSNCYYSSSDAAFADRYEASAQYSRIAEGTVPLDGGWRVYSSGPGLALSLLVGGFLGLRRTGARLVIDPVMPATLDGLQAQVEMDGLQLQVTYRPGPLGHGPRELRVGDQPLPAGSVQRLPHVYRKGGLSLPLQLLRTRAREGIVRLSIHTD